MLSLCTWPEDLHDKHSQRIQNVKVHVIIPSPRALCRVDKRFGRKLVAHRLFLKPKWSCGSWVSYVWIIIFIILWMLERKHGVLVSYFPTLLLMFGNHHRFLIKKSKSLALCNIRWKKEQGKFIFLVDDGMSVLVGQELEGWALAMYFIDKVFSLFRTFDNRQNYQSVKYTSWMHLPWHQG